MSNLSISAAWEEAKAILTRDARLYAAVALALVVLPEVVMAVVGSPVASDASPAARIVYVAVVLLGIVAQVAINRLAIGPSVTVSEAIILGFARVVPIFIVIILAIIIVAILAALVAMGLGAVGVVLIKAPQQATPGLILILLTLVMLVFAVTQLTFPIAAVETGNPLRLISRSLQLARGNYWRLLGFVMIAVLGTGLIVMATQLGVATTVVLLLGQPKPGSMSALILGFVAGLLQAGFTLVIGVMLARIYVQLAGRGGAEVSVPSSGI
jgi:hypothetical protein